MNADVFVQKNTFTEEDLFDETDFIVTHHPFSDQDGQPSDLRLSLKLRPEDMDNDGSISKEVSRSTNSIYTATLLLSMLLRWDCL